MKTATQLGIWMDHAHAHLSEYSAALPHTNGTTMIQSRFTHDEENSTHEKSEKGMHNKEQHLQADYYKKLGEFIRNYDEVLLYGPTDAKVELLNILRTDHRFDKIEIQTKQADKMSENQQHAFVRDYFSNR
ncbi:MAG: hypothetical protein IPM69_09445 [Ignavibacteria bacterium]|nr:hypothetical protein [Ignavibacteria bacterium]